MKIYIIFGLIVVCLQNSSCKVDSADFEDDKVFDYHVKKDIILSKSGENSARLSIKHLDSCLGLNSLELGYDSVQIRIWFFYGGESACDMVLLKNRNNNWYGSIYKFLMKSNGEKDRFEIVDIIKRRKSPKRWDEFIKKLFDNNIKSLPDCSLLKESGYGVFATHPGIVFVEFADKNIYRLYQYFNPVFSSNHLNECKQVEMIIKTIGEDLEIPEIKERFTKEVK